MRAKFRVDEYTQRYGHQRAYVLHAVTDDGTGDNIRYHMATPSGELKITIDNPAVVDFLQVGKSYFLDFTAAD